MNADLVGLIALVVLLAVNAYFVGAEFAVISARRSQIEPRAERGSAAARTTLWAMEHATLMLATTQLGITVCSLLILNVSEPAIHHLLTGRWPRPGCPPTSSRSPPSWSRWCWSPSCTSSSARWCPRTCPSPCPTGQRWCWHRRWCSSAGWCKPIIVALNATANAAVRLVGIEPREEATSAYTLDEVATIVSASLGRPAPSPNPPNGCRPPCISPPRRSRTWCSPSTGC